MYNIISKLRIKKLFLIILILLNINILFANSEEKKDANAILVYEQCNKTLYESEKQNIKILGENLCIFILEENSQVTILSKKENEFGLNLINDETLEFLKKNYYRGQKINIYFSGYKIDIKQKLEFNFGKIFSDYRKYSGYRTLNKDYKITFLQDNLLEKFNLKECEFISYNPKCREKSYQEIIININNSINPELLEKKTILNSDKIKLKNEKEKIDKIISKIKKLTKYYNINKYKDSYQKIYFTINYIIYRLEIYNKILENKIGDLEFKYYLKKEKIFFIDKKLLGDLYISQSNQFTFFIYKDKIINTLNNDTSHFNDKLLDSNSKYYDIKLSSNLEYLKEKIRDKYSAEYIKNYENKFILITKNYISKRKYLLFDIENEKLFTFYGEIKKIEKGKKGYYILLNNNYSGKKIKDPKGHTTEQIFVLYDGKKVIKIIDETPGYSINDFELLIGKKVKIFYTIHNGGFDEIKSEEVIDISKY